jgi:TldD protein
VRSFPKSDEGNVLQGGREVFDALKLEEHSDRIREEAIALCYAPPCPDQVTSVILDADQLSLQIHESCGHPTEADRALREELSLAGSSFLTPERMREGFRYGSDKVNLVADATTPLGPGTFGWDDEGTPAGKVDLVREGIFTGYLTSRATSERIGCAPIAACRAESWNTEPIVRMVNINLEPGSAGSLDDLISSTDSGLLIKTNRSWSIDDHRLNFQFGCQLAQEIKGGRLGQIYRNPVYTGITPEFWAGCDAICGPEAWEMWGWFFCGKGDPPQLMHVGHGTAPARFRDVHVCSS